MNLKNPAVWPALIASAASLGPFLSGLIKFKLRPSYLKLLWLVAGVSLLFDVIMLTYQFRGKGVPGYYNLILHFDNLIELILFLVIFFIAFHRKYKVFFISLGLVYSIACIVILIILHQEKYSSYGNIMSSLICLVLSVVYFFRSMSDGSPGQIGKTPMFLVMMGILFYCSGSFFVFCVYNFLADMTGPGHTSRLLLYWNIHAIATIISRGLFTISFWKKDSFLQTAPL